MKTLTTLEEKQVLSLIPLDGCIDCGSSRRVYECPDEVIKLLGLDPSINYVIKLGCGQGGFNQNSREVEVWLENEGCDYLAPIYAAGRFIIIMEAVDVCNYIDFARGIDYDDDPRERAETYIEDEYDMSPEDANYESTVKDYEKAAYTITQLAYHNGNTCDNGQLGMTASGRYVAYDYGFISDVGCDSQCSEDLVENIYDDKCFNYYIDELKNILDEIANNEKELNGLKQYMISLERTITSGDWMEVTPVEQLQVNSF